ncbi:hypothetical protein QYE76_019375 [Lolium multiflorum]|uniref:Uncharacterized protein n=1 Tax=Lolium multiflorum TaxID=4521 RepID=A0AAD8R6V6_LOLMU|nr:hypothetical protein QYE76_019375 [Lolium multiflorum]
MVATEFLSARIAPLQKHRHGLQDFDLHSNMSLGRGPLEDDMVGIELNHLIHTGIPVDPLEDVLPLYHDPQKASILEELPEFGGKGLLNSAPMDESLDSELPEALAPSAIVAAHQGAEVEGDGESSHAIEEEEDPKTHPVKTGPSSIAVAVEGPRPAAEGRTPLSTGWVSEAFDEDEAARRPKKKKPKMVERKKGKPRRRTKSSMPKELQPFACPEPIIPGGGQGAQDAVVDAAILWAAAPEPSADPMLVDPSSLGGRQGMLETLLRGVEAHDAVRGTGAPLEKTLTAEGPLAGEAAFGEDQATLKHPAPDSADAGEVGRSPSPSWPTPRASPEGGEQESGRRSHGSPVSGEESVNVGPVLPTPPPGLQQCLVAARAAFQRSLDECVSNLVVEIQALASKRELFREEQLEFKMAQEAAREDLRKLRDHADEDVAERLKVVELKEEAVAAREGAALTKARDLDARALQLDSDRTRLQEERNSLQAKLDAAEGQAKKLKEVSASLSTAEGEVTLLKESIATLQIELSEATKLRQRRADHMRSVNAQRSKELVALVADMESLFPRLGLNPLPALVVPEDDDGEALAAHLRLMFTAFVKMEPLISDLIAKDSANLLRSAGRRIFYHLQRLGISVDFQELMRSAPKAEDLVKIDGGVATEKNI